MSDDLDDFLRQAAERRAKRQQQRGGQSAPSPAPSPPSAPPPQSPQSSQRPPAQKKKPSPQSGGASQPSSGSRRPTLAEVTDNVRPTVGHLEPTLADRHVYSDLSMADERMEEHIKDAFRSDLSPDRFPGDKKKGSSGARENVSATAPTGSEQSRAMISSLELKQQLRDPQTLRLAIIAHEILRRPFQ